LYASWGQGVESDVAPNRSRYTNAGEPLPALKSEQSELGLKIDEATWAASFTAFDIRRPAAVDLGRCDDDGTCTRLVDGNARHRGVEASGDLRLGAVTLRASTQWLRAQREGASNATDNGLSPTNVAERSARLAVIWQVAAVPGLSTQASLSAEGPRYVLPDNSLRTPGWANRPVSPLHHAGPWPRVLLRLRVDNLFDQRAWKKPYQFGPPLSWHHAPGARRSGDIVSRQKSVYNLGFLPR
jgi:iron complex outermembrane receptor protein